MEQAVQMMDDPCFQARAQQAEALGQAVQMMQNLQFQAQQAQTLEQAAQMMQSNPQSVVPAGEKLIWAEATEEKQTDGERNAVRSLLPIWPPRIELSEALEHVTTFSF